MSRLSVFLFSAAVGVVLALLVSFCAYGAEPQRVAWHYTDQCLSDRVWYGCVTNPVQTVVCSDPQDGMNLLDDIAAAGGIRHTLDLLAADRQRSVMQRRYASCDVPQYPHKYAVGKLVYRVGPLILVRSTIETMPFITLESDYVGDLGRRDVP
ncbi:MAG: hypothetical protein QJR02_07165 [Sinobacteraceae bacterium]|nr:hypothetical protein [Nevskiaceae bacterium]